VHQLFEPSALNVVIFDTVSVHQFPDKAIKNNIFHQSALHATFRLGTRHYQLLDTLPFLNLNTGQSPLCRKENGNNHLSLWDI